MHKDPFKVHIPLKILPNTWNSRFTDSLLKKRLRPTLATKIRGKYGKASLKPHNTSRATEQAANPPSPTTAASTAAVPASPPTPPDTSTPQTANKEDVVVETPPVSSLFDFLVIYFALYYYIIYVLVRVLLYNLV